MNKFFITATLLFFTYFCSLHAQDQLGVNLNVTTEAKFTNRLSGEIGVDTRFQDLTGNSFFERIGFGVGLGYKIINTKKFDLKTSAGFEYIRQVKPVENEYTKKGNLKVSSNRKFNRTRTSVGIGGSYKPNKRWSFSLKETVQYNHYGAHSTTILKFDKKMKDGEIYYNYDENALWRENYDNADDLEDKDYTAKDRFVLRNKLTVKYDIRHSIFSPYASVDYGCGLNYSTSKWKFSAGTEIEFSKKHNLDVFYRYQTEDDDDEPNGHIIGVGYILKF